MRMARKLSLLAVLILAATALASPSAFAVDTEPELHNQTPRLLVQQEVHAASDVACPAALPSPPPTPSPTVTSGGCRLHLASNGPVALSNHWPVGGVEILAGSCNMEFDVRVDSAGEGWVTHQELTAGSPNPGCGLRACGQVDPATSEGRAFSFYMRETEPAPRELATFLMCFDNGGTPAHCEYTLQVSQPTVHRYAVTAIDIAPHGGWTPPCPEWNGSLLTEAGGALSGEAQAYQNVEIRHT